MGTCYVCGSDAHTDRLMSTAEQPYRFVFLCRYHEFVCSAHLQDPCPVCDGGD